jgi:hypothetical protein
MAIISKDVLYDMYVVTELGGKEYKAYEISKAPNKSGYSFGQCQWDLLGNPGTAAGDPRPVFEDILRNATDFDGNKILSDKDVEDIMKQVAKRDGNTFRLLAMSRR